MLKKCILVTLAVLLALPAVAQDAKTVIANASKAMGYDQLRTIEYSGSGFEGTALGQAEADRLRSVRGRSIRPPDSLPAAADWRQRPKRNR
ncbi:MAG: hypothetical protein AUG12_05085 [Acidobacteria bacterium 13_1_20CM_2_57_8]|nr:MAG: hypothetical protein AUG12_05085 [Acidobacteria bacterium 13_1_20CM_2_57_8]